MKESEFYKLTDNTLWEGANLCLKNSKDLFEIAELTEQKKKFGLANSLLILSIEESVKGLICILQIANLNLTDKIESIFSNHKSKHNIANHVFESFRLSYLNTDKVLEKLKKKKRQYTTIKEGKQVPDAAKYLIEFFKEYQAVVETNSSQDDKKKIKKWFNRAYLKKNEGFYINYENNKWTSPNDIDKNEYDYSKEITIILIDIISQYKSLDDVYFLRDNHDKLNDIQKKANH